MRLSQTDECQGHPTEGLWQHSHRGGEPSPAVQRQPSSSRPPHAGAPHVSVSGMAAVLPADPVCPPTLGHCNSHVTHLVAHIDFFIFFNLKILLDFILLSF